MYKYRLKVCGRGIHNITDTKSTLDKKDLKFSVCYIYIKHTDLVVISLTKYLILNKNNLFN
jgi:hypothetical protein